MIQMNLITWRTNRLLKLGTVLLCTAGLMLLGLTACGKKGQDGMGPGTEITGETGTGETGGTGSPLPIVGETPGDTPGGRNGQGIQDIFFDYDRYEIRAEARRVLQENARYLMDHAESRAHLEGHCDERGTNEYNLALGQKRADAVLQYLADLGVDVSRLSTVSYGEEKPFSFESNEAGWAENRRVHFVLK